MKTLNLTLKAFSAALVIGCSSADKSHETPVTHDTEAVAAPEEKKEKPPMDSAASVKAMQEYMTPGEMHQWMARANGKWEADMTFWMGPDAKPMPGGISKVEYRMILGDRYQDVVYKGKMMGMDFEGHGTMAFDNAKKKFIQSWIDNTGTGLMYMEGPYDASTNTINFTGKMVDPATWDEVEMRQTLKTVDDKNMLLEMYSKKNGKEYKSMEIKLARK